MSESGVWIRCFRKSGIPAALLVTAALASGLTGCSQGDGGMFQEVTIDPAKERVMALEDDTDAVNQALLDYFAAFDNRNTQDLAAMFTERAEVYLPDGRVLGAAQFIQSLPDTWNDWSDMATTFKLRGATLSRPYGWAKLTASLEYQANGQARSMNDIFTFGVEKRGDIWLISHLHISGPAD